MELAVTGHIPAYAAGTLYRTGPGGYKLDTEKGTTVACSHWFDGFSKVHRFQIVPSTPKGPIKVLYNSRTTVDGLVEEIRRTGSLARFTFGQKRDLCQSLFGKVMSAFQSPLDKYSNIGVTVSADLPGFSQSDPPTSETTNGHASGPRTLWAKTDAAVVKQLDPATLESIRVVQQDKLHPELRGALSAAHAKSDPKTGDVFNYNLDLGRKATYRIFRVSASTGKTDVLARITEAEGAYLHSLFLTESYVVLCVWSGQYAYGGIKILWDSNILDAIAPFDQSKPAKWYVVDRQGQGVVATYESEPFFAFHAINAWEEASPSQSEVGGIDIVADLAEYENLDILKRFYYDNLLSTSPAAQAFAGSRGDCTRPRIARWRLTAVEGHENFTVVRQARRDWIAPQASSGELPVINSRYATQQHRYMYAVTDRGKATFFDGIVKLDTKNQEPLFWNRHGHSPSEPIFIPDPNGHDEDDGVLLSVVLDGFGGKSYLLCLDAKNMTELGQAGVDGVVAFSFHGVHVAASGGTRVVDA